MRSAFVVIGFQIATFEMWIGMSFVTMPPCSPFIGLGRWCFFTWLMPATSTCSSSTRVTSPRLPLSRPVITTTLSPFLILRIGFLLQGFRREGADLQESLGAQLARDRPEDARADRFEFGVEEDGGVRVEANLRAVVTAHAVARAHHDGVVDLALLDASARRGVLHRDLDHVADVRVAALRPAEHLDAHHATCTGVVGDVQYRLHLDNCCFSNFILVSG